MRIFEILLMAIVLINQFAFYSYNGKLKSVFLSLFLMIIALFILHFLIEGVRWQMIPLYLILAALIILNVYFIYHPDFRPLYLLLFLFTSIPAISVSLIAGILWPVFKIPPPSGPYPVGSSYMHLTDTGRSEIFTKNTSDHREIPVLIWYPSKPDRDGARRKIFNKNFIRDWAFFTKRPEFFYSYWRLIKGNSKKGAPLNEEQASYPVLIFSHGYLSDISFNVVQMEELASHGYVVVSVGHPYESSGLTFPDGKTASIIGSDGKLLPHIREVFGEWTKEGKVIRLVKMSDDKNEGRQLLRQYISNSPKTAQSLKIWVDDLLFVIDQLTSIQNGRIHNRFTGKLNLKELGAFGFSFGGGCAVQSCVSDSRIKAAVNIDCVPQYGNLLDTPIEKPLMMIYSGRPKAGANDVIYDKSKSDYYRLIIDGSTHNDMSVLSLSGPYFKIIHESGPTGGGKSHEHHQCVSSGLF